MYHLRTLLKLRIRGEAILMKLKGNPEIVPLAAYYGLSANFKDPSSSIEFQVRNGSWQSTLTLPIEEFNTAGIHAACAYVPSYRGKERTAFDNRILNDLLHGLELGTVQRGYYLDRPGAVRFPDGHVCFIRGSELIGVCNRPILIAPELNDIRLLGTAQTDPLLQLPPLLLQSPPQVPLVLAFVVFSSIRSVLVESGLDPQAVLYIVGKQGLGKTTLAQRMAGIYERSGRPVGVIQAGATHAAVNTAMVSLRDQAVVIDDLCLSASRDTARRRIDLASKLIRQGTGTIPISKMEGNKSVELPCESSLIFTAEFTLENLSDLSRCIIVPVQKQLNIPDELTPMLIGDAIRFYSKWFCDHLEQELTHFQQAVHNRKISDMGARVDTNYCLMRASMQSFLRSLRDLRLPYNSEPVLLDKMDSALSDAIQEQQGMIERLKDQIPVGNIAFCIFEGYKHNAFNLTSKMKKLSKHDGIIWKGDLCLRKEPLVSFVRQQPGYQSWSSNKIVRTLKDWNALVLQEDSAATVHLTKDSPRVYRIRLDVLEDAAQQY